MLERLERLAADVFLFLFQPVDNTPLASLRF